MSRRTRESRPAMPNGTAPSARSIGMISDQNGLAEARAALVQATFALEQTRQKSARIDALSAEIHRWTGDLP